MNHLERGSGIPLVWIHGFPLHGSVFDRQLSIPGVRHIVPDLPGFGDSPGPAATSIDAMAREVLSLLDQLSIPGAVFAGLSMGGYILFAAARIAPQRFLGAILIDTREAADSEEGRRGRLEMIEKVKIDGLPPVVSSMLPKMVRSGGPDERFVRQIMESTPPETAIASLEAMANREDSADTLRSLSVPVLIVAGEQDTITPPADAMRMHALLPHAELAIIADAAHLSNVERPAHFNERVASFLRQRVAGSLQS